MISVMFVRAPIGEYNEPSANHQPGLAGAIDGERLTLRVHGEKDFGLREMFDGRVIAFKGQETYDELRKCYLEGVGSAFGRVTLQRKPHLGLEQTEAGWRVLRKGGAEHPHFDGLVDRLRDHGFDAEPTPGRNGFDAVAIQIPEGKELETFARLAPIIKNTI